MPSSTSVQRDKTAHLVEQKWRLRKSLQSAWSCCESKAYPCSAMLLTVVKLESWMRFRIDTPTLSSPPRKVSLKSVTQMRAVWALWNAKQKPALQQRGGEKKSSWMNLVLPFFSNISLLFLILSEFETSNLIHWRAQSSFYFLSVLEQSPVLIMTFSSSYMLRAPAGSQHTSLEGKTD